MSISGAAADKKDDTETGRFLFLGNQLALDFVNTRPVMGGQPHELLPDLAATLDWFSAAELLDSRQCGELKRKWRNSRKAQHALAHLLMFRELLREEVLHWEGTGQVRGPTIDLLNQRLANHPMLTRVRITGKIPRIEHWFDPKTPTDLIAPIAQSAAELFSRFDHTRVRKCETCVLHFLDISKKGSRRWCSMQFCGNRSKVAAYAARQRERG